MGVLPSIPASPASPPVHGTNLPGTEQYLLEAVSELVKDAWLQKLWRAAELSLTMFLLNKLQARRTGTPQETQGAWGSAASEEAQCGKAVCE